MKIAWKDFAQRRKLNLDMFENMSYAAYVAWCVSRNVEPEPSESFSKNNNSAEEPTQPLEVKSQRVTYDEKQLKKLKKSALVDLCENSQVDLNGNETKAKLINILVNVNNEE